MYDIGQDVELFKFKLNKVTDSDIGPLTVCLIFVLDHFVLDHVQMIPIWK